MERCTLQQRIEIIKIHYKNGENLAVTVRKTRTFLGDRDSPCRTAIRKLVRKFELLGQVTDVKNKTRARRSRTVENIAVVAESVEKSPNLSIPRRSLELDIPKTSLHRILHKDLGLKAYTVQLTQEFKPADHQQRRVFADWVVEMHENDLEFHRKIFFSDEAYFHLGGFVNKQNFRIWGSENPRVIVEKPLYPQRVTVWCGLWSSGVIGPYFFENDAGATVTVNGLRYREMINNFLWPELDGIDLDRVYFQQDGATCHTSNETNGLLREKFQNRVISRRGDHNWPPRFCDLTLLDFFLWGHLNEKVYTNSPASIQDLKDGIREAIEDKAA